VGMVVCIDGVGGRGGEVVVGVVVLVVVVSE
jgi:hypothetical protein